MSTFSISLTIFAFLLTILFVMWRPRGLNEAIPATCGAVLVLISGTVSFSDFSLISEKVSGAAITIMATIVMAIVLESFGFFQWAAEQLMAKAKGSGIRLFWLVNLLCFLMTLFVNNDGSILITTPILCMLLDKYGLKNHQKIPYLLSGGLIATASSAPIGVSNIVNLIALKIVGMNLYQYSAIMFVPAMLGLLVLVGLLFLYFNKQLPRELSLNASTVTSFPSGKPPASPHHLKTVPTHPLKKIDMQNEMGPTPVPKSKPTLIEIPSDRRAKIMRNALLFVFFVRVMLFVASYFGVSVSLTAVIGSLILLAWRWYFWKISPMDMLKKTPWYILVFAFGMYVIIYGLHNIGLTTWLVDHLKPLVSDSLLHASLTMGLVVTTISTLFNNHPALMIGTLTLTNMGLNPVNLQISYLAGVIGSDLGSLLLPMGTLASLMWMHIVNNHKVKVRWKDYIMVTFLVIPPALLFTLICLYCWFRIIF